MHRISFVCVCVFFFFFFFLFVFFQLKYLFYNNIYILFQFFINLCFKPISMVWMKVKISFGVSRKGHNSSLPIRWFCTHKRIGFPCCISGKVRQFPINFMEYFRHFGVLICTTINDILPTIIILSIFFFFFFFFFAQNWEVCKMDNFLVLKTGRNQS